MKKDPALKLLDLYDEYREDDRFKHLRDRTGIRLVPGRGVVDPVLFIVGEAPGATENLKGLPFVGQSGRVLASLMHDCAQIPSTKYFITNVVKYQPPGNRTPGVKEILDSLDYLRREYKIVGSPPVIVAVGATAFHAMRPDLPGIAGYAGSMIATKTGAFLCPMFHPAFGLRNEKARPTMERHWEYLGQWLREEGFIT